MQNDSKSTDFGFEQVTPDEKTKRVAGVFSSVASSYDVMNDLMSLGTHRVWKHFAVNHCGIRSGQRILDLAGGTGDLTTRISPLVGPSGQVYLADINAEMLTVGRDRLLDKGLIHNTNVVQVNAETLPFPDNFFDRIIIGFGLRNVTDKLKALQSMCRVLKPAGRLIVLEFSKPTSVGLGKIYDTYSFKLLPKLGDMVANDADSYRYLAESIRMHPDQNTLKDMIIEAGFDQCEYHNLSGGIVAVHRGVKY